MYYRAYDNTISFSWHIYYRAYVNTVSVLVGIFIIELMITLYQF